MVRVRDSLWRDLCAGGCPIGLILEQGFKLSIGGNPNCLWIETCGGDKPIYLFLEHGLEFCIGGPSVSLRRELLSSCTSESIVLVSGVTLVCQRPDMASVAVATAKINSLVLAASKWWCNTLPLLLYPQKVKCSVTTWEQMKAMRTQVQEVPLY